MDLIKEVWLFTKDGNPIAEYCQNACMEESLIPNLAKEVKTYISLLDNVIQSFDFVDYKITFSPALKRSIYIVCIGPISVKNKKLIKICKEIVNLFEGLYTLDDLIEWDGDLEFFEKFKQRINLFLQLSDF